jgi:hypothetical protein
MVQYVLESQCIGLGYKVYINGVPVSEGDDGSRSVQQSKISQWLINGSNRVDVELYKLTDESKIVTSDFKVTLLKGELGKEPGTEGVLLDYSWDEQISPISITNSIVKSFEFEVIGLPADWLWLSANTAEISHSDKIEIVKLLKLIYLLFKSTDIPNIMKFLQIKHREIASAMGITQSQIEQGLAMHLKNIWSDPEWKILTVNWENLLITPLSNNRLYSIKTYEKGSIIQIETPNKKYMLDLIISKVAGRWTIVR